MERTDLEQWTSREVARLLALVEAQRRYYQDVVASLPVGVLVLSADLEVILANAAVRKLLGLRPGEPLPRRAESFLPRGVLGRVEEVLKTGVPETGIAVEIERAGKRRFRVAMIAIRSWDNETTQEALLTLEDISSVPSLTAGIREFAGEPARMEVPVEAQTAPAPAPVISPSRLIDNLDAAIWAVELSSMRFVYVSPQAESLLGFPAAHWTGSETFWENRVYADDRETVMRVCRAIIDSGQARSCEFRALKADGSTIWLRESARLLPDPQGRPRYLIGITVDVTERRLLEDQLAQSERVEAVSKLASRMAHDLNNMLMILTGYGEDLLNSLPAGSTLRPDVQEILSATERMSGVTRRLLEFARKPPAVTGTSELEPVLADFARRFGSREGTHIALDLKLSREPSRVPVGAEQLEQIVTAILDVARLNARAGAKGTLETSHIEIREDVRRGNGPLKPGAYALIAIEVPRPAPHGPENTSQPECLVPGKETLDEFGAGLTRTYGVIRQLGGDLAVSSGPNQTCIYRIFFPRLEALAGLPAEPALPLRPSAEQELRPPVILVVEDEAGIRALVRKILRRQNYEVLEASNGEEALSLCQEYSGSIDLLITDVIMPEMGGRDLADRLREQGRVNKVLFVSGYTDDTSIYAEPLPPGSAFLQKPFTLGSLLDKVREVLAAPLS